MKILSSYIFRALCAMLVGFLLVSNPETMTTLLVQIIGGLFTFSGVVAIIGYFVNSYQRQRLLRTAEEAGEPIPSGSMLVPMFPVVGIGSLAFGVFLLLMPDQFVNILMYVLGALMVLAGGSQCLSLISYRKVVPLTWSVFVLPLLILAAGIFVVCQPQESASLPFTILGIACICYGATEFFNGLRLHRYQKKMAKEQAAAAAAAKEREAMENAIREAEDATYEEIDEVEEAVVVEETDATATSAETENAEP